MPDAGKVYVFFGKASLAGTIDLAQQRPDLTIIGEESVKPEPVKVPPKPATHSRREVSQRLRELRQRLRALPEDLRRAALLELNEARFCTAPPERCWRDLGAIEKTYFSK